MERILLKTFKEALNSWLASMSVRCVDKRTTIHITPNYLMGVKGNSYSLKHDGSYTLDININGNYRSEFVKTYNLLITKLHKNNADIDDHTILIESISGFKNIKEYQKDAAFKKLNMAGILEKYKSADSFSLTQEKKAIFKIDHDEVEHLENDLNKFVTNEYKDLYKKSSFEFKEKFKKSKQKMPRLDQIILALSGDINKYFRKHKSYEGFIDEFNLGKMTYNDDTLPFAYNFYKLIYTNRECEIVVNNCFKSEHTINEKEILNLPTYKKLIPHLKTTELIFVDTHINMNIKIKFTFLLNNETRNWLSKIKSDYDFNNQELCDLVLYKDNKAIFVSDTKERFHLDYSKSEK